MGIDMGGNKEEMREEIGRRWGTDEEGGQAGEVGTGRR